MFSESSFPSTGLSRRLLKGRLVARDAVARKNSTPNLNAGHGTATFNSPSHRLDASELPGCVLALRSPTFRRPYGLFHSNLPRQSAVWMIALASGHSKYTQAPDRAYTAARQCSITHLVIISRVMRWPAQVFCSVGHPTIFER
jgi:hypothetical protein